MSEGNASSASSAQCVRGRWGQAWHYVALAAILLLAAWLRFEHLDHAEFQWDQGEISKWALRMGRQGQIAWVGPPSSTGLSSFLGAIWLYAIPYALSPSPVFATGFVAAINLAAVVGCYLLARRLFGATAALVASLLYTVGPWAVIYSRKVWHTTLLPPFVLLYVASAWPAFVRGRRWALVLHPLALALLVQLHFSTLPFVLLTVLWIVVFRRRIAWRPLLLGGALAALTFAPYLVVDAGQGWRNVRHLMELLRLPSQFRLDAWAHTCFIATGLHMQWLTGPDRYAEFVAATPNLRVLFVAEGALVVAGCLLALGEALRWARRGLDDTRAAAFLVATWCLMPALFLTRNIVPPAYHYFTTVLPAPFILVGWLADAVWRRPGRAALAYRVGLGVFLVLLALTQAYEVSAALRFVRTHDTLWGYGTPLVYELRAVESAQRLGREIGASEVIVLAAGDEPRQYEMAVVADVLMFGQPHRTVDIRSALVLPSHPAVYWAAYDRVYGEELLAVLTPEVEGARIVLREGRRSFRFYRWPGGTPVLAGLHPLPGGPREWANGARLVGYRLEGSLQPGAAARWTLVWQPQRTPGEDVYYHWFNHLLDGAGALIVQHDGPSMLPAYWRPGDTVLNWYELTLPSDASPPPYTMRVGMYVYPALQNVPLAEGGSGESPAWIEIPLQPEE